VKNESKGVYGQATRHVTDLLSLMAGIRYSTDDEDLTTNKRNVSANGTVTCRTNLRPFALPRAKFDGTSYTGFMDYKVVDTVMGRCHVIGCKATETQTVAVSGSRCHDLPCGHRLSAINPQSATRDEMTLCIEVVVDGGMGCEEALCGCGGFEPLHLALASSDRPKRILRPVVLTQPVRAIGARSWRQRLRRGRSWLMCPAGMRFRRA